MYYSGSVSEPKLSKYAALKLILHTPKNRGGKRFPSKLKMEARKSFILLKSEGQKRFQDLEMNS